MMDRVDLDVSQARADLLPDKYARRRVRGTLAIRRLSSQHCKRSMSECDVCTGWLLLLFLFWTLHHVIHSKHWQSFKRRHAVLVWFVSLPVVLCWYVLCVCFVSLVALGRGAGQICKIRWNEFMESDAVCDGAVMLGLYGELISDAWLFLERHWPTTEIHVMYMYIELRLRGVKRSKVTKQPRLREVRRSKVTKEPTIRVVYVLVLSCGMGWAWFRSLLTSTGPSHLVIRQLLIISGDVELNPGPLDHGELS